MPSVQAGRATTWCSAQHSVGRGWNSPLGRRQGAHTPQHCASINPLDVNLLVAGNADQVGWRSRSTNAMAVPVNWGHHETGPPNILTRPATCPTLSENPTVLTSRFRWLPPLWSDLAMARASISSALQIQVVGWVITLGPCSPLPNWRKVIPPRLYDLYWPSAQAHSGLYFPWGCSSIWKIAL